MYSIVGSVCPWLVEFSAVCVMRVCVCVTQAQPRLDLDLGAHMKEYTYVWQLAGMRLKQC